VGVLRVLEELRVPIDCIAGTSAGSAVGAAYASGRSPDEIERLLGSVDWDTDMFNDAPPRREQQPRQRAQESAYLLDLTVGVRDGSVILPSGVIAGQKIDLFLHRLLGASTVLDSFDQLPIPFRAIATDLEAGEMVVQDRGSLATAVRASMAVPSAFDPVTSGGRLLVDGGLTRNMPVDVVRGLCADVVIAVDIGSGLLKREELGNVFAVASQMISILMERNMRDSRAEIRPGQDVLIHPDLGDIGAGSFSRGVQGIPAGEAATRAVAADLQRLALGPDDYAAWQAARIAAVVRDDRYAGVEMIGTDPGAARVLLSQAALPTEGTLDRDRLEREISRWTSSGDFDRIGYSLVPAAGGQTLQIEVVERALGPNFLRFGLGAAIDSKSNALFEIVAGYRRPRINSFGGEFKAEVQAGTTPRLSVELFQPVNRGSARGFVAPTLLAEEIPYWIFIGQDRISTYAVKIAQGGLDAGLQGRYGEARLGVYGGHRREEVRTGPRLLPQSTDDYYGVQFSALLDQLDAFDFPRDGYLLGLTGRNEQVSVEGGDTYSYRRAQLVGKWVTSWGDHTVHAGFRVGESSDRVPLNQVFSLGGFMNLSGLQVNQLLGTSLRYAALGYQYRLLTLPSPLGRGVYGGLALETGEMRGTRAGLQEPGWVKGATAYLGAATALGPIYLGYGVAGQSNRLLYLFLGRPGL
jgi:NTE family protein